VRQEGSLTHAVFMSWQAELQSQVANMAAMVRQMHCHREKHLSTQISGLLEFEMQTCGSLYTGLDYILQKHS